MLLLEQILHLAVDTASEGIWTVSNGNATVAGGVVTGVTAGVDTISYSVTGSCGTAFATKVITINNSSVSGITGMTSVCLHATTTLIDTASSGNMELRQYICSNCRKHYRHCYRRSHRYSKYHLHQC